MNILTISFYKDFARYFLYLQRSASALFRGAKFDNYTIYPCAQRYFESRNVDSKLIAFDLRCYNSNITSSTVLYRGYDLNKLTLFTMRVLGNFDRGNHQLLKQRAAAYIDYYEKAFRENRYSLVFCAGDTRLPVEVCVAVAKRHNVDVWYFEQGPFNTTFIDHCGVNANCSFAHKTGDARISIEISLNKLISEDRKNGGQKYWLAEKRGLIEKIYDYCTLLSMYPPRGFKKLLPIELSLGTHFKDFILSWIKDKLRRYYLRQAPKQAEYLSKPFIALLFQVPTDAQFIMHSPNYFDFDTLLTDVLQAVPAEYSIVVREHPLHIGKYGSKLYKTIASNSSRIELDNDTNLDELIDQAALIVVNNSTAGMDAMRRGKSVLAVGDAFYTHHRAAFSLSDRANLPVCIRSALKDSKDPIEIEQHLKWLYKECLIPGHYHDEHLRNARLVIRKIVAFYRPKR